MQVQGKCKIENVTQKGGAFLGVYDVGFYFNVHHRFRVVGGIRDVRYKLDKVPNIHRPFKGYPFQLEKMRPGAAKGITSVEGGLKRAPHKQAAKNFVAHISMLWVHHR